MLGSIALITIVFFIIAATGAKRELNLVLVMGAVGLSVLRTLKREIRKLISKKPKNLNETKARAILLHLEGMKISEIAKILLGLYVVRADYPSVKVNILACIPLFDGKPCFMLTMLILGFSLFSLSCLGLGILVMSC